MATTIPNLLLKYSGTSILDLLQSSSNGVLPLKSLGKTNSTSLIRRRRRDLSVSALIKKGEKKDEHPYPDDADPNVKGGVLSYLSHFKPLKTKPKPVTLDFERPLMDLEKKIIDVRKMAQETGLDFSDQIIILQNKYKQEDRRNSVIIGVSDDHIGLVVGRGGGNLQEITQVSGERIKISDR